MGIGIGADRQGLALGVGTGDEPGVALQHVAALRHPIAVGKAAEILGVARLVPVERQGERAALGLDPFGAAALLVAEPQHFLGRLVEGGEQLPLPAVPDAGADRADVDDRQHQQQAQPLGALYRFGEIEDRLEVRQVALERGVGHQEVIADQPGDRLGLGAGQAEARPEPLRDLGTKHRMVAAASLGDVVEQHRDVEHAARCDLVDQFAGQRMIGGQLAMLDPAEQPDRAQAMLVDGIMMIHVELHLRDDPAEDSFIVRSTRSGSRGEVSTSRNKALARASPRTSALISRASRLAWRSASG